MRYRCTRLTLLLLLSSILTIPTFSLPFRQATEARESLRHQRATLGAASSTLASMQVRQTDVPTPPPRVQERSRLPVAVRLLWHARTDRALCFCFSPGWCSTIARSVLDVRARAYDGSLAAPVFFFLSLSARLLLFRRTLVVMPPRECDRCCCLSSMFATPCGTPRAAGFLKILRRFAMLFLTIARDSFLEEIRLPCTAF